MKDLNCPYCNHFFYDRGDHDGYIEGSTHEFECPSCDKIFMASISHMIHYSEFETPCKNDDGKCAYVKQERYPLVRFGKTVGVSCQWCDERKEIPLAEAINYGFTLDEINKGIERFSEAANKVKDIMGEE